MGRRSITSLLPKDKYSIATGFIVCMLLWLGMVAVDVYSRGRTVSESRAAGLASLKGREWRPSNLWQGSLMRATYAPKMARIAQLEQKEEYSQSQSIDQKIVRKGTLNIFVTDTGQVNQRIQEIASTLGGYVVSTERNEASTSQANSTTVIRIPSARFDTALDDVRKLALRIDSEQTDSTDVTKQFVDIEASLRNLHAEEAQYLQILRQAKSVKDTLDVTEHLSDVRGQIEKLQGELNYLRHEVEMSSLSVGVRADSETKVWGIYWRPLFQAKMAFRYGIEGIITYCDFMLGFIMYIPVIMLWIFTIAVVSGIGYRFVRWTLARLFPKPAPIAQPEA